MGTVFRYGDIIGLVSSNPVAKVKKPRAAKRAIYILSPEDMALLLAAFANPRDRLMAELDYTTALRSGEIRGLTWKSVDLKAMLITVRTQATRRRANDKLKTESSERTVPIAFYRIPAAGKLEARLSGEHLRAWYFPASRMRTVCVSPLRQIICCATSCGRR